MKNTAFALSLLLFLELSLFVFAVQAQFPANIYIHTDGSVVGTNKIKQEGQSYTLIDDISGSAPNGACFINILKDNIVFDGAGYTIQGTGTGIAVQLEGVRNVTVKNLVVNNFGDGVDCRAAFDFETDRITNVTNIRILNNTFSTAYWGISLRETFDSVILDNTLISLNNNYGLMIGASYNNIIENNRFFGGGLFLQNIEQNTFSQNIADGKAIVVLENQANLKIDDASQVLLFSCDNITVTNTEPVVNLRIAVQLSDTNNSHIVNSKGVISLNNSHSNFLYGNDFSTNGLKLLNSHNNKITANTINPSSGEGISLEKSNANTIYGNIIKTRVVGIQLVDANHNAITGNSIIECETGIKIWGNMNSFGNNTISDCKTGIQLSSDDNLIVENAIVRSSVVGIQVSCASGNRIYHNNFVENVEQVVERFWWEFGLAYPVYSLNNSWDDGAKGNYWSSYQGQDLNGDSVGDMPYQLCENFTDYYPLMNPVVISTEPVPFASPTAIQQPTSMPTPLITPTLTPTQEPTHESTLSPQITPNTQQNENFSWPQIVILGTAVVAITIAAVTMFYVKKRK